MNTEKLEELQKDKKWNSTRMLIVTLCDISYFLLVLAVGYVFYKDPEYAHFKDIFIVVGALISLYILYRWIRSMGKIFKDRVVICLAIDKLTPRSYNCPSPVISKGSGPGFCVTPFSADTITRSKELNAHLWGDDEANLAAAKNLDSILNTPRQFDTPTTPPPGVTPESEAAIEHCRKSTN